MKVFLGAVELILLQVPPSDAPGDAHAAILD
jgi:hypothetical protein